jgi:cytochrome c
VFKQRCAACHAAPAPGAANRVGPQLNGIVGRKAASVADYPRYSQLAKDAAPITDTWEEEELFKYLEDPTAVLRAKTGATAGASTMTFKLADEAARKNVIAYLAQFDATGAKK